jgi:putative hydrolase of the HAD superfamily
MALAAVTLDAGGTLFEVAEPVGRTYARLAARHGILVDPETLDAAFAEAFVWAPPLAFPGASPSRLADHERAWWYAIVRHAFGETAAAARGFDACFDDLFAHYARPEAWRVFPEVPAALAALRARGLASAVVSNFDGRLPALLDGLGLAPLVDHVVYSARTGAAKPDARIFRDAVGRMGVAPARALHAGDSLHADVEGARAAGLHAALVARRGDAPATATDVPVVRDLSELAALTTRLG